MANEYLISKWRTWFGYFDHKKGGKVSAYDMEKVRSRFSQLSQLEGEQKSKAEEGYAQWFKEYVLWGKKEITVDEYIELNNKAFSTNRESFIERIRNGQEFICHFADTAHDGFVSEEEFVKVFKAAGHDKEDELRKFYEQFHPVNHKIPIEDMIQYWTHYLTSDDFTEPDAVKKGFDLDVYS